MSVLVKGMKMPDSCYHCKIAESCGHYIANYTDRRHPDCPLIALPEHHGRLVDADALRDRLRSLADDGWNKSTTTSWAEAFSECADMVEEMPTIEPRCETCEAFNKTRLLIPQREKGEWIYGESEAGNDGYYCSKCGNFVPWKYDEYDIDFIKEFLFCNKCGAEMRNSVETARDIVHESINNSVWSDTVDTAKMHKVVDDKYAEMTEDNECQST